MIEDPLAQAYFRAFDLIEADGNIQLMVAEAADRSVVGCLQLAQQLKKNEHAVFVTILCDSGDKYLSERFWQEG